MAGKETRSDEVISVKTYFQDHPYTAALTDLGSCSLKAGAHASTTWFPHEPDFLQASTSKQVARSNGNRSRQNGTLEITCRKRMLKQHPTLPFLHETFCNIQRCKDRKARESREDGGMIITRPVNCKCPFSGTGASLFR